MDKKDDITFENFQSCVALSVENVELERKLARETDEEKRAEMQAKIDGNNEALSGLLPTSRVGICSCKAYIANSYDTLRVALFVEEHPAAAEKINIFLPEVLTKEEIDIRTEALKNMTEKVSNISQEIELRDVGTVSVETSSEDGSLVEGN